MHKTEMLWLNGRKLNGRTHHYYLRLLHNGNSVFLYYYSPKFRNIDEIDAQYYWSWQINTSTNILYLRYNLWYNKRLQFELMFISQMVYILLAIMSYTGIDNFLGLLIFHICGQLDIIKNCLTCLDQYINSHDILKNCVTKHVRLLRFAIYVNLYL